MADASNQRVGIKGEAADQIFRTDFHPTQIRGIRSKQTRKIWGLLSGAADETNKIWGRHSVDRWPASADSLC